MEAMKLSEIVEAVDGSFGFPGDSEITTISTDTRKIEKNSVFIALQGENFDGHDYAQKAMELGAEAVITERAVEGTKCIIVDSTHKALLNLAAYYRNKFDIKLVGVTGSVGKTTTKEMIYCVVSQQFKTLKTQGNHNNEIGLPLTMFDLNNDHEAAVIEMGMSHVGEISRLSLCAQPTMAIITNIGFSHIENLGTQENILKAKLEILDGCSYDSPLILNKDDKLLATAEIRGGRKVVYYSASKKGADCYASDVVSSDNGINLIIHYDESEIPCRLNCVGEHNVKNCLSAFCVGRELGIPAEKIVKGIEQFKPDGMRQNIQKIKGMQFIIDCYNASPDSMKAGASVLSQLKPENDGRRIAVLADMLELGKMSKALHKGVGEVIATSDTDYIYAYGEEALNYIDGAVKKGFDESRCRHFNTRDELAEFLMSELKAGDVVWFKGSRGMKLEEVINSLS